MAAAQKITRRAALQIVSAAPFCVTSQSADDPDATLVAAIAEHGRAVTAWRQIMEVRAPLLKQFAAEKPDRPVVLRLHGRDCLGVGHYMERTSENKGRAWYACEQVEKLRQQSPRTVGRSIFDEWSDARRVEIIAAHDVWMLECAAVAERIGLRAVNLACAAASDREGDLYNLIADQRPRTIAGLAAKVRWFRNNDAVERGADDIFNDVLALASEAA